MVVVVWWCDTMWSGVEYLGAFAQYRRQHLHPLVPTQAEAETELDICERNLGRMMYVFILGRAVVWDITAHGVHGGARR